MTIRSGHRLWAAGCAGLSTLLPAAPALAHTGHELGSFSAGLLHPFGLDHLLAMVAVGVWSVSVWRGVGTARGPLVFMAGMALGALFGLAMGAPLGLEMAIAGSVAALGGLLLLAAHGGFERPRARAAALVLVGVAGSLHGLAHGAEAPMGGGVWAYALGFLLATAGLHAAGLAAGLWARHDRARRWGTFALRAAGTACAVLGIGLVWAA